MIKRKIDKKEFRELVKDMAPHIVQMCDILNKHKIDDILSLDINSRGYVYFRGQNTDWSLHRTERNENATIQCSLEEEIDLEDGIQNE